VSFSKNYPIDRENHLKSNYRSKIESRRDTLPLFADIDREISKYYYDYRLNQLENIAKKRGLALIYGKNGGINNG
jgi:hypothetical protein